MGGDGFPFDLKVGRVHAHALSLVVCQTHERLVIRLLLADPVDVVGRARDVSDVPDKRDEPISVVVQDVGEIQCVALSHPVGVLRRIGIPLHLFDVPEIGLQLTAQLGLCDAGERALDVQEAERRGEVVERRFLAVGEADGEEAGIPWVIILHDIWIGFVLVFGWMEGRLFFVDPAVCACNRLEWNRRVTYFLQ